jgi:hypothetical protein
MAVKTKIKKDELGLYTICGGYISRPFYGTQFEEGDSVNTHHFDGSTQGGVTICDRRETHNFKKSGIFEYWITTGIANYEYKKREFKKGFENLFGRKYETFEEYLYLNTEWYRKQNQHLEKTLKDHNKAFIRDGKLNKLLGL